MNTVPDDDDMEVLTLIVLACRVVSRKPTLVDKYKGKHGLIRAIRLIIPFYTYGDKTDLLTEDAIQYFLVCLDLRTDQTIRDHVASLSSTCC